MASPRSILLIIIIIIAVIILLLVTCTIIGTVIIIGTVYNNSCNHSSNSCYHTTMIMLLVIIIIIRIEISVVISIMKPMFITSMTISVLLLRPGRQRRPCRPGRVRGGHWRRALRRHSSKVYSLPQIRRQRELPRTSEVCPYKMKDLVLRTWEVFCPRG